MNMNMNITCQLQYIKHYAPIIKQNTNQESDNNSIKAMHITTKYKSRIRKLLKIKLISYSTSESQMKTKSPMDELQSAWRCILLKRLPLRHPECS